VQTSVEPDDGASETDHGGEEGPGGRCLEIAEATQCHRFDLVEQGRDEILRVPFNLRRMAELPLTFYPSGGIFTWNVY
jgi:hypothetical protein